MTMDHFSKDPNVLLIHQLFSIQQPGSVSDYIEKFSGLVDQLIAYGKNTNPLYYVMHFCGCLA